MGLGPRWWQWTEVPDPGTLLKVEPMGLAPRWDVGCNRKRGIKDDTQILAWEPGRMAFPLAEVGRHAAVGFTLRAGVRFPEVLWTSHGGP